MSENEIKEGAQSEVQEPAIPQPEAVQVEPVPDADSPSISEPEVQPVTPVETPTPIESLPTPAPEPIQETVAPRVSFWKRLKPQHYALIVIAFVIGAYGGSVRNHTTPIITPVPTVTITVTPTLIATPSATITPAKTLPIVAPKSSSGAAALLPSKR